MERALDHLRARIFHIVAQVIEPELVVGTVGDVRIVSVAPLLVGKIGDDHADSQPEEAVDLAHPAGVAAGEVVIHGDDVDALPLERIEVDRERRDQGLAFAGLHLGDLAAVKCDAADQLDVVMALAKRPRRRFADRRERLGQQIVDLGAVRQPALEQLGLAFQLVIGHRRNGRLEPVDGIDIFAEASDVPVVSRSEDSLGQCGEHEIPLKTRVFRKGRRPLADAGEIATGDVRSAPAVVN